MRLLTPPQPAPSQTNFWWSPRVVTVEIMLFGTCSTNCADRGGREEVSQTQETSEATQHSYETTAKQAIESLSVVDQQLHHTKLHDDTTGDLVN